jgi:hypothetical protein
VHTLKNLNGPDIRDVREPDLTHGGLRFVAQKPSWRDEAVKLSFQKRKIFYTHLEPRNRFITIEIEEFSFTGGVNLSGKFGNAGVRRLWAARVIITVEDGLITLLHPIRYPVSESSVIPDRRLTVMVRDDQ